VVASERAGAFPKGIISTAASRVLEEKSATAIRARKKRPDEWQEAPDGE
jgi:hypothetical protein